MRLNQPAALQRQRAVYVKILLSAFAYAPNTGSESGVGWRWALELARNHEVYVVTDVTRQPYVEASGVGFPADLHVVYYRPRWIAWMPLNSFTAQLVFALWQYGLPFFAKKLHGRQRFDLAIHSTYGVFRHPSFLGTLGIPFIYGPVGGGEDAPWALKKSIHRWEKVREVTRSLGNQLARLNPFLRFAYSRATLILATTDETRRALPYPASERAIVYSNMGVDMPATVPTPRKPGAPMRTLFAGRLLGWKGAHLAIRAVAQALKAGANIEFTLLGKGPYGRELRRLAAQQGVADKIRWVDHVPFQEFHAFMQQHHCFLYPSLHDSGGTVVIDAQACGLPVICLDLGGPGTNVTTDTAMIVNTARQSEADVVAGLSAALVTLAGDESRRQTMCNAAAEHARKTMNWEQRVNGALELVDGLRLTQGCIYDAAGLTEATPERATRPN